MTSASSAEYNVDRFEMEDSMEGKGLSFSFSLPHFSTEIVNLFRRAICLALPRSTRQNTSANAFKEFPGSRCK